MATAFGWYTAATYPRLREVSADKDRLPVTFQEWEQRAQAQFDALRSKGIAVEKVLIDPDALFAWTKGATVDSNARSQFAAAILMKKYEAGGLH